MYWDAPIIWNPSVAQQDRNDSTAAQVAFPLLTSDTSHRWHFHTSDKSTAGPHGQKCMKGTEMRGEKKKKKKKNQQDRSKSGRAKRGREAGKDKTKSRKAGSRRRHKKGVEADGITQDLQPVYQNRGKKRLSWKDFTLMLRVTGSLINEEFYRCTYF